MQTKVEIKKRLEYLRKEIKAERISYGETAELQSLIPHIDPGDVLLLEWAGVAEGNLERLAGRSDLKSPFPYPPRRVKVPAHSFFVLL